MIVYIVIAKVDQTEYVDRHGECASPFLVIADVFRSREDAEVAASEWKSRLDPEDKEGVSFMISERFVK